jgi:hypothetical protein
VDPPRPRRLWPPDQADVGERLAGDEGDLTDVRPRHARNRVEIDAQLVGVVEILRAYRVRVHVDAAQVDDPRQSCRVVDNDLVRRPAGREGQLCRSQPLRPVVRCALLEERLALGPVDEALQRHRAPGDPA